jgi:hypothetical protein
MDKMEHSKAMEELLPIPESSMTPATPLIISLMFCLENEQGHIYSYNLSVGKAARLLGWDHMAAVRAAAKINAVPDGWQMCLGTKTNRFTWRPLTKIEKMVKLIWSLMKLLREQSLQPRPVIYLLEWFDPVHFIAFCLALMLTPRRSDRYVWLLHRFEFPQAFITDLYRFLHNVVRWRVGRWRLVLFSETDLVATALEKTFGQRVYVLPMPQIILPDEKPNLPAWSSLPERQHYIVCWWPGMPATNKGLTTIEHLTRLVDDDAPQIYLLADQKTGFTPIPGGCQVMLLPTGMPRADYLGWLYTMDMALLPYDPQVYATRTSGPFADAIVAGKPPVVTDHTWMAHELRKYQLDKLILDWNSPSIFRQLIQLAADVDIHARLAKMRSDYLGFHSVSGYAETIKAVFEQTCI